MSLLSLGRRPRRPATASLSTETVSLGYRRGVLWVLGLLAILLWGAGGLAVVQALAPSRLHADTRQAMAALQPWLPGAQVQVPEGAGLWQWQQGGVSLLAVRAQAATPVWLDLCEWQAKAQADDPRAIYDVAIGPGLNSPAVQRFGSRRPVVLPEALANLMPLARVTGRVADAQHAAELRLQVSQPTAATTAAWAVAGRLLAPAASGSAQLDVNQPAWLLLGGQAGMADAPKSFSHALRVQWLPSPSTQACRAGQLRLDWFDAAALPQAAQSGPALLWAWRGEDAPSKAMSLHAGLYQVPEKPLSVLEDQALFEQAQAQGVLAPLADGRLGVLAPDQGRQAPLPPATAQVLKRLHRSDNGAFVLRQVTQANQSQHWLAVRVRRQPGPVAAAEGAGWRAQTEQELLGLQPGLPGVAVRLDAQLDPLWSEWVRIAPPQAWTRGEADAQAPVALHLPVPAQGLEVQVLGRVLGVQGASLRSQADACRGPGCVSAGQIQQLHLTPAGLASTAEAVLMLQPDLGFARLNPARVQALQVVREAQGAWRWAALTSPTLNYASEAEALQARQDLGLQPLAEPARVQLSSRQGDTLVQDSTPTALAQALGLDTLVGLGTEHAHSLLGNLQRLGQWGQADVHAVTTLDAPLQAQLSQILRCVAQQDGRWQPRTGRCEASGQGSGPSDLRRSEAVLMNARTGEILALAHGTPLPQGATLSQLLNFDAFHRARSTLLLGALHHSGDSTHAPGSTYKVFNALSLEQAAQQHKLLLPLLAGVSPAQLEAVARAQGKPLSMGSACYPADCEKGITNFGKRATGAYAVQGVLGLREALRASSNTWFAFMTELADRTVAAGRLQARPLGKGALAQERPLHALSEQIGFDQALPLDGGLLPKGMRLRSGDVLLADASRVDPLDDLSQVRHQGIGMRMQTTALHMARVMAGVATGRVPQPQLLASLNGVPASAPEGLPLEMPLSRVRAGMGDVVQSEGGTAFRAFSTPALQGRRHLIFGKTGSAPLASGGTDAFCKQEFAAGREPLRCLHNAWFVGYVMPGLVPGVTDPLAFAVRISHSRETGGAKAAPVVADLLASLVEASPASQH